MNVAIVEDCGDDRDRLLEYLDMFTRKNSVEFRIYSYESGDDFLSAKVEWALIFMDIELPGSNGIEIARNLRVNGCNAVIVLITNMVHYAVEGYSVQALDFIVKPVKQAELFMKLPDFIAAARRRQKTLTVKRKDGMKRYQIVQIRYIEVFRHTIIIHAGQGPEECYGTLKQMEEQLRDCGFAKCSKSYLVNFRYIERILKDQIQVDLELLPLSRREQKNFMQAFTRFDDEM